MTEFESAYQLHAGLIVHDDVYGTAVRMAYLLWFNSLVKQCQGTAVQLLIISGYQLVFSMWSSSGSIFHYFGQHLILMV